MSNIEKELRSNCVEQAEQHVDENVGVFLSGGVDSQAALFSCLEVGIRPVCLSFTRDDKESTDFKCAREIAKKFDLEFVRVPVCTDVEVMFKRLKYNILHYDLKLQTDIECVYIIKYAFKAAAKHGIDVVFTGHGADTLYGSSKDACMFEGTADQWRTEAMSEPNWNQRVTLTRICKQNGISYVPIFQSKKIIKLFKGTTFKEVNRPGKKRLTKEAFSDYFLKIKGHTHDHQNYQKGDTDFKKMFAALVDTKFNIRNNKSQVGIFNDIKNGKI